MPSSKPIGVFDSGLGGLSILSALRHSLPRENYIFLGDGARCPYGDRSREEVIGYTFEAVRKLMEHEAKLIVIACNTATAAAVEELRKAYPGFDFVGLEPAVKPAALTTRTGTVAVLATSRSFMGDLYRHTSAQFQGKVRILEAVGKGFVEIVERGEENSRECMEQVRNVVEPLIEQGADRIVLGCTHYPFLRNVIQSVIADRDVEIIDSSEAVCRRVDSLLTLSDSHNESEQSGSVEVMTFAGEQYRKMLENRIAQL